MGRGTGRGREGEIGDSERKEKEDVKELEEKGEKGGGGGGGGGEGGWVWEAVGSPSLWGAAVDRGSHYTATLDCPSFYSQPIIISFFSFFDGRASWGGSWIILYTSPPKCSSSQQFLSWREDS